MSRRGWVMFIAMCVIWGIPYLLIKVADTGVSVPVLVLARVGIGAALLFRWRCAAASSGSCCRTGDGSHCSP